ncbi:MAG: hypothetical protein CME65_08335 [Halobacteriovoraceae bacterium]|nr:hypothetical protein [Halobacteriovoraceae bacterium]|tara:strand:- start:416 stop:736 length:321 start_codon:yes stop_codon:yes gene_type:complete
MDQIIIEIANKLKFKIFEKFGTNLKIFLKEKPTPQAVLTFKNLIITVIHSKVFVNSNQIRSEYELLDDELIDDFVWRIFKDIQLFIENPNLEYENPKPLIGKIKKS